MKQAALLTLISVGAAALAIAKPVLAQTTLFSEDFNSVPSGGSYISYNAPSTVGGFTVVTGGVDSVNNGFLGSVAGQTTGNYLDLDGTGSGSGKIVTAPLTLQPGTVTLSFALAGSQRGDTNTVHVSLGNLYSEDFTLASNVGFTTITRPIIITSAMDATLTFDHTVTPGDNIGLLLDDVKVVHVVPSSIPEPATMVLALPVLGILAGIIRKRSRA